MCVCLCVGGGEGEGEGGDHLFSQSHVGELYPIVRVKKGTSEMGWFDFDFFFLTAGSSLQQHKKYIKICLYICVYLLCFCVNYIFNL